MSQIIWITGASSGLGKALAIGYAHRGLKLILSSRNIAQLEEVRNACPQPHLVAILPLDLSDTDALPAIAQEAWNIHGKIDIVIHSGGVSQRGLALQTQLETEQNIFNINFWGTVVLSKVILQKMIEKQQGHIVCISSLVGKFGTKYRSAYAASKHALHGYFDSLRSELHNQNIDITIICPGFIKTNVSINALTETGEKQGTMDDAQNKGMSAQRFAEIAIGAIDQKKEEVYIGGKERIGIYLKRFFPAIFSKIMRKAKVT